MDLSSTNITIVVVILIILLLVIYYYTQPFAKNIASMAVGKNDLDRMIYEINTAQQI